MTKIARPRVSSAARVFTPHQARVVAKSFGPLVGEKAESKIEFTDDVGNRDGARLFPDGILAVYRIANIGPSGKVERYYSLVQFCAAYGIGIAEVLSLPDQRPCSSKSRRAFSAASGRARLTTARTTRPPDRAP